jgi:hypothetical protein
VTAARDEAARVLAGQLRYASLNDRLTSERAARALDEAGLLAAQVDVDGIARVLDRHRVHVVTAYIMVCHCSDSLPSQSSEERWTWHRAHQAERVVAYLRGEA